MEEEVVNKIKQNSTTSLRAVANELKSEMEIEVSHKVVGRMLKDLDYAKTKPISIPALTNSSLEKRFKYAKDHLKDRFWNVCFSDETVFQLNDNKQLVWWSKAEEVRPVISVKSDKRKVMVWGGICRKGKTSLYFWKLGGDFSVDSNEYKECLEECLLDKMDSLYGKKKWRFMQDNARPHISYHTQRFLEDNDVKTIVHPPYSPDLNPIEKVWSILKRNVMKTSYSHLDDIIEKIMEEWDAITNETLNRLIDGHCNHVKKVYEANGDFLTDN